MERRWSTSVSPHAPAKLNVAYCTPKTRGRSEGGESFLRPTVYRPAWRMASPKGVRSR
jgi:hypothetical protein